jgi:ATP-dependent DNA helicase RecG
MIEGPRRRETSDYPIATMEQLARNAVLHRNYEASTMPTKLYWYADRIEITNPGGLYGEVTPETIWRNATAYRNPALADGLKVLGLVDRFGFGLVRAREALAQNGNPPLRYEFLDNFVMFRVEPVP